MSHAAIISRHAPASPIFAVRDNPLNLRQRPRPTPGCFDPQVVQLHNHSPSGHPLRSEPLQQGYQTSVERAGCILTLLGMLFQIGWSSSPQDNTASFCSRKGGAGPLADSRSIALEYGKNFFLRFKGQYDAQVPRTNPLDQDLCLRGEDQVSGGSTVSGKECCLPFADHRWERVGDALQQGGSEERSG